jgi:excisionase family DNA binding protein
MEENVRQKLIEEYKCLVKALNDGDIPYYHKMFLSIDEAARYTGIGQNKMREICDKHPELNIWNGNKRLIKRARLEKYLDSEYSI